MHPYLQSLIGGLVIGTASAGLLLFNGRIAGISGILFNAVSLRAGAWRWAFLGGLVAVGAAAALAGRAPPASLTGDAPALIVVSGLLVGIGTHVGSGCTSGHGVCGLSRLSVRSLVATAVFMASAGLTVLVTRHTELVGLVRP
jgi:uncharacterized membrane protein YedE/YeeE